MSDVCEERRQPASALTTVNVFMAAAAAATAAGTMHGTARA
jgi:hypothetical protein